jgi:hypothetical protein
MLIWTASAQLQSQSQYEYRQQESDNTENTHMKEEELIG